mgnify:FL=1
MIKDFLKFIIDKDVHLIIIYILLGWIVYQIIKGIIIRNTKRLKKKRQKTMQKLIQNIVKYVVIVLVGATILNILGVNVTSIVAGLGVVSVILSLALKDVMQDILAGLSIIFEDQFDIGDLVEINGFTGTVIDLGLKSTKIKSYENTLKIISNRSIIEVINYSKTNPNVIIDIPIPYEIDNKKTDKVIDKIIKRTEKEVETLKGNIENWGLNEFKDSCISYRIFVPVKQETQFSTKRKINRIIKEEFDKENISVPYNIIEVKNG